MSGFGSNYPDVDVPPPWDDLDDLVEIVTARDVTARRVTHLWEGRVPLGSLTLMPGEEGIGKTTVSVRIIADLTNGELPGEFYGTPRDVVVLALEDGLEEVFRPRLEQAGADLERVHIVVNRRTEGGDGMALEIPRDLPVLGRVMERFNAALLYVDSLVTCFPDDVKTISYKDTAKVLKRLNSWAEALGVAVLAPWHLNKGTGTDTAVRMMDSRAFRTAVRSLLLCVSDPDAEEGVTQGIVALDKSNGGTIHVPALKYALRGARYTAEEVDLSTGEIRLVEGSCGVAEWIGEIEGDGREIARQALAPRVAPEDSPEVWLRDYLKDGEKDYRDLVAAGEVEGFSVDRLKRARRKLGIESRNTSVRVGDKTVRSVKWHLPGTGTVRPLEVAAAPPEEDPQGELIGGMGGSSRVRSNKDTATAEATPSPSDESATVVPISACPHGVRHGLRPIQGGPRGRRATCDACAYDRGEI